MTVGPLMCAVSLVLMSRIGPDASYVQDVLPAVIVLGLGLSLLVAPLTATALGSLDDAHAGIASGVNNAVARAAGARVLREPGGDIHWTVMADPEGNEFCVFAPGADS